MNRIQLEAAIHETKQELRNLENRLRDLGLPTIENVRQGAHFRSTDFDAPIFTMKQSWHNDLWQMTGLCGDPMNLYSDYPLSKDEMVATLRKDGYRHVPGKVVFQEEVA